MTIKNCKSKIVAFICFALIGFNISNLEAQDKPSKVHSIIKENKPHDWYTKQYDLWTAELDQNKNNPDGWVSYYTTTRMAKLTSRESSEREQWVEKMDAVVEKMKKAIEGTYEYHYILAYHLGDKNQGQEHVFKAYEMDPERPEVYDELLIFYEKDRDKEGVKEVAKKWKKSGDMSPTLLLWNYNMLVSTAPNAILITVGDNDTYPAWVLQHSENVRTDVTVLNTSLMYVKDYREKMFREMGIPQPEEELKSSEELIKHLLKHKGTRPLYFSIGSTNSNLGDIKEHLYNVGLALRYDESGEHNTSLLIKNFERHLMLDHLTCQMFVEEFPSETQRYNFVYLSGLLMLHQHYALLENSNKRDRIATMVRNIVVGTDYESKIEKALEAHCDAAKCK